MSSPNKFQYIIFIMVPPKKICVHNIISSIFTANIKIELEYHNIPIQENNYRNSKPSIVVCKTTSNPKTSLATHRPIVKL